MLFHTGASQHVVQAIVALVARILEERAVGLSERLYSGERPGERSGVLHRVFVAQRVPINAGEALGKMQGLPGPDGVQDANVEAGPLRRKVSAVYDQGIIVPLSA